MKYYQYPVMRFCLMPLCLSLLAAAPAYSQPVTAPAPASGEIVFASDTQAPMWIERLLLKANHNRTATRLIFNNMLQQQPRAVFLLGDVVNLGYSNKQWRPIDGYLQSLRAKGITVEAALGNHEVMGRSRKGQQRFQARFPDHNRTGYVQVVDSVAVILLNSNFSTLSASEDAAQVAWYQKTLAALDADPGVQFIITGCHHSPYTNSHIVKPSVGVQQRFVPLFLASKKSQLFLSGHCHGFEHYQVQGKDFLVIGGGGGLHQPLNTSSTAMLDMATDYKPMFHYLTVSRAHDHLQVTSRELKPDFSGFDNGLTLNIQCNGTRAAADMASAK